MEIQTDQGLLVVNLENCISNAGLIFHTRNPIFGAFRSTLFEVCFIKRILEWLLTCVLLPLPSHLRGTLPSHLLALQQIAKGDCIYTLAVTNGDDSSTMLQIPVTLQCSGNLQHGFNSQLQQQSQNASQQYTQQQFDQVQIAEQLQCLLETNAHISQTQLKPQDVHSGSIDKLQPEPASHSVMEAAELPDEPLIEIPMGYNEVYNYLDTKVFPSGALESYKKRLLKKSKLYSIINKTLYHGLKKLKKVVTNAEDQLEILHSFHVQSETGVHLGVRKMHSAIVSSFFWEGVYVDVTNFVRHCKGCSEAAEQTDYSEIAIQSLQPDTWTQEQCSAPNEESIGLPLIDTSNIWHKVEAQVYGPFYKTVRQNEYLLTLSDPESRWIMALPVPNNDIITRMASFIFETFCVFGFAKCNVVTSLPKHFKLIDGKYNERVQEMKEVTYKLNRVGASECKWVEQLVESVTTTNPADWDREQDKFLYKFRTSASDGGQSPFAKMFQRCLSGKVEEEKENVDDENYEDVAPPEDASRRRRLQSSILECRHCDEVFTSKISFRIHQRKHTEDARHRGTLEGQEPLKSASDLDRKLSVSSAFKKQALLRQRGTSNRVDRLMAKMNRNKSLRTNQQQTLPKDYQHAELKANTLAAVKQVLASTKDSRRRRGKYKKYTSELHEEMARYAIEHGNLAAVNYFTEKLGCTVSESTVRNIVKLHRSFTPEIKEEIGRYATAFGIEAASAFYSERLERAVRQGLVRKFKKLYMRRFPDVSSKPDGKSKATTSSAATSAKQKSTFSAELREEIGCYACQFSISDTVLHYSQKSQLALKENTVRKFRKLYLEKCQKAEPLQLENVVHPQILQTNNIQEPVGSSTSQTIDILNASLNLLNNPQMNNSSTIIYNPLYQSGNSQPSGHLIPLGQATPIRFHAITPNYTNIPTSMAISYLPQQHQNSIVSNQSTNTFNQTMTSLSTFPQSQNEFSSFNQHQQSSIQSNNSLLLPQLNSSNPHQHVFATNTSVLPPSMSTPITVAAAMPQTQQNYNQGGQTSLLLPNQQLIQIQLDKQIGQSNKLILSGNNSKLNSIHIQSQNENIPIEFEQVLQSPNSEIPFRTVPTLIADRDGTYTIRTTINTDEPLTVHEEEEEPRIIIHGELKDNDQVETVVVSVTSKLNQDVQPAKVNTRSRSRKLAKRAAPQVERVALVSETEEDIDDPGILDDIPEEDSDFHVGSAKKKRGKRTKAVTKKPVSKKVCVSKRGTYTTYSPEIRAKMGKHAAEHGSQSTCAHFRELLGHDVPESTVRGLRDRYLLKCEQLGSQSKKDKEVTSLGYSPRGRPMRLGKYDQVVQECIWELVRSGEKVSSFLAVTTAKQVLMQYEPSLLEENGGNIKLNVTWAKSFLKRIGVHSNT